MNLHQYDLNLLVIFDAIFKERHLTKAGEKLNMSQPAMSQALGRLRDLFNDPLFVRSGNEMVPTAQAKQIAPQVRQVLFLTEQAFTDRGAFDPSTSTRTFKLAMSDYTEMVVMPRLFKRLQTVAPNIRIESKHLSFNDYQAALDYNYLDLILACQLEFGANVYQQSLFQDKEVVVARADSPALKETLTLERYASYKHAQFQWFFDANVIDYELQRQNLTRRVVLEVQHEMVLPLILKDNEVLVNMPERMANVFKELLPLEILDVPLPMIRYQFQQFWHERSHNDPAHQWLRAEIKQLSDAL